MFVNLVIWSSGYLVMAFGHLVIWLFGHCRKLTGAAPNDQINDQITR